MHRRVFCLVRIRSSAWVLKHRRQTNVPYNGDKIEQLTQGRLDESAVNADDLTGNIP